MVTLIALDVGTTIDFGSVALGAVSSEASTTVTNTGNSDLDFDIQGTSMVCTIGSIPVANQKFSLTSSFDYSNAGTELAGTDTTVTSNILARTSEVTPTTGALYLKMQLPTTGVSGTCTGTNTFTAAP